jgi:alpha-L-rhamnosidase
MAESAWQIEDGMFDLHVLIPPNTTALVTLPGGDTTPIKVGSGSWHWSLPYQDPDVRGPYTVDDLIGDITYDPAARDVLMNVLQQVGAPDFLMGMLLNERNVPLREALLMLSSHEKAVKLMSKALASL